MLLIISAHVALIALVMSAKMEFKPKPPPERPLINVPIEPPPPPNAIVQPKPSPTPPINYTQPDVPLPHPDTVQLVPGPPVDPGVAVGGGAANGIPQFPTQLVTHPPRSASPDTAGSVQAALPRIEDPERRGSLAQAPAYDQ